MLGPLLSHLWLFCEHPFCLSFRFKWHIYGLGDNDGLADGLTEGLLEGLIEAETDGLTETLGLIDSETDGLTLTLGLTEALTDGLTLTLGLTETEAESDGLLDGLILTLGDTEGDPLGLIEALLLGLTLALIDGETEGEILALTDGEIDGLFDGLTDGETEALIKPTLVHVPTISVTYQPSLPSATKVTKSPLKAVALVFTKSISSSSGMLHPINLSEALGEIETSHKALVPPLAIVYLRWACVAGRVITTPSVSTI